MLTRLLAPFIAVRHRAGVGGAVRRQRPGVPTRCTWRAGPSDRRRASIDDELATQVALVRRLVELGRAARAESKVKTRQPLARALVSAPGWAALPAELRREVADELNVRRAGRAGRRRRRPGRASRSSRTSARWASGSAAHAGGGRARSPRPTPRPLADALAGRHRDRRRRRRAGRRQPARTWWSPRRPVRAGRWPATGAETVALDLELTHELRLAGLVRDIVRLVQDARKNAGFEVTDRIELWWRVGGSPEPAEAIRAHTDLLRDRGAAPPGSPRVRRPSGADGLAELVDEELGLHVWLRRSTASGG